MYCTATDLEKLLAPELIAQLSDDGIGGQPPEEVIAEAISQAARELDTYLGQVRPVPLSPVPPLATDLTAKIAVYNLHRRRPHLELGEWGDEYKRCLRLLEKIAKGEISLGALDPESDDQVEAAEPTGLAVKTAAPHFNLENY